MILIGPHPFLGGRLGFGLIQEQFGNMTGCQIGGQIVKRTMPLAAHTGAIRFAAGGETFDVGGPQQIRGYGQQTQ